MSFYSSLDVLIFSSCHAPECAGALLLTIAQELLQGFGPIVALALLFLLFNSLHSTAVTTSVRSQSACLKTQLELPRKQDLSTDNDHWAVPASL